MDGETNETNETVSTTEERLVSSAPPTRESIELSLARQQMEEMRALNRQLLDRLDRQPEAPKAKVTGAEFLEDPMSKIERLLDEKLSKVVAPLQAHFERSTARDAYNDIKDGLRTRFGQKFKDVEHLVDGIVKGSGNAINEGNVLGAFAAARGMQELGLTGDNTTTRSMPTGREVPNSTQTPPSHAPSNPQVTPRKKDDNVRPLTESEKFMARRMNLSEDRYREYQDIGDKRDDGSTIVTIDELNQLEERRKAAADKGKK